MVLRLPGYERETRTAHGGFLYRNVLCQLFDWHGVAWENSQGRVVIFVRTNRLSLNSIFNAALAAWPDAEWIDIQRL